MTTVDHRLVDGNSVTVRAENYDLNGLATSRALFRSFPDERLQTIEAAPAGYSEALRVAARQRSDLEIVSEFEAPRNGGMVRAAVVERTLTEPIDAPGTRFVACAWEGRAGSLIVTLGGDDVDVAIEYASSLPIREDALGAWVELPIDVTTRPPFFLKQIRPGGLVISQPMTETLARSLPNVRGEEAAGGELFVTERRSGEAAIVFTNREFTEVVATGSADRPANLARQLVVTWN